MITRRKLLVGIGLGVLSQALPSLAQTGKVWRIGLLETTSKEMNGANFGALRKGLAELGYVEGRNLLIEYRSADGLQQQFDALAGEIARLKVDLIVTRGTPATHAANKTAGNVPVVAAACSDMVETGLAKSLARPGGKVTGLDPFATVLTRKRVELIKEAFPKITRIGSLGNMGHPLVPKVWKDVEAGASAVGLEAVFLDFRKAEDLPPAFASAVKQKVGALIVMIDTLAQTNRATIAALAAKHRLPALYVSREFVDAGGLMSFGVSYPRLYYRAASYVDKIFKGAKPGDLPIEQATQFELIINLRAAKAIGVAIPETVKFRADEVIE